MDSSPSDTPHRSRPRRWNVAADMPGFASGAPWRGRAGRGAYGCMALPRVAFWCASESFFVFFRRVCRAARGASLPLLGGCAAERGAAGSSAVWLWAALLVAGIVAFGVLSRRLRNENVEEPSAFGFLPDVLRWSNICSRFRGAPPAEEQPPLTPFSSDLALIDEILLQACDRDAEILLSPAPVTPAAGGEADAGFGAPLPPVFPVSAFSRELESSLSDSFSQPLVLRGTCFQSDVSRVVLRTDNPLDERAWQFWAGRPVLARLAFSRGYGVCAEKRVFLFASRIWGGHPGHDETLISLTRPTRIERVQHRLFPRTTPAPEDVTLGFWPWPVLASLPAGAPAGKPALVCGGPALREGNARLENLSASGAGIAAHREAVVNAPQAGVLLLSLRQGRGAPLTLWLACSLRHATLRADGVRRAYAVLGYALEAWSPWEQGQDFRKPLSWRPVAPGGEVPVLPSWILRDMAARRPLTPRFFNLQKPGASLGR